MKQLSNETIRVLFIGDIVGKPGRNTVKKILPSLKRENDIDFVIANGENMAAGKGMTYDKYLEMLEAGIDYFTSGNHIWNNRDIIPYLDDIKTKIIRPANYPANTPGRGFADLGDFVLVNLQGRVFMKDDLLDPFSAALKISEQFAGRTIIVDFHAEATSEKVALSYYLNGKVAAVLGTHTHVQTADEKILDRGTAFISDVGMTGPEDSVLGIKKDIIIEKFLTQLPQSHKVASGDTIFNAVIITINKKTNKTVEIKRVNESLKTQGS